MLSLLSYEGSVAFPFILAALEFFLFAKTGRHFGRRVWASIVRIRWYGIVLLAYLAWWAVIFHGETGSYDPARSLSGVLHNYYTLFYQLFHGNSRLAGIIYFGLSIGLFRMARETWSLAAFSTAFMLIAFIPFMLNNGFASRFGYASAVGYGILLALMIHAVQVSPIPRQRRGIFFMPGYVPSMLIFIGLAVYYGTALHSRIADWRTAG